MHCSKEPRCLNHAISRLNGFQQSSAYKVSRCLCVSSRSLKMRGQCYSELKWIRRRYPNVSCTRIRCTPKPLAGCFWHAWQDIPSPGLKAVIDCIRSRHQLLVRHDLNKTKESIGASAWVLTIVVEISHVTAGLSGMRSNNVVGCINSLNTPRLPPTIASSSLSHTEFCRLLLFFNSLTQLNHFETTSVQTVQTCPLQSTRRSRAGVSMLDRLPFAMDSSKGQGIVV